MLVYEVHSQLPFMVRMLSFDAEGKHETCENHIALPVSLKIFQRSDFVDCL